MLERLPSAVGESWRLIRRNRNQILLQLAFSSLTLLLIGLLVTLVINTNYLLEVFESRDIPWKVLNTLLPVVDKLARFRIFNYLLLAGAVSLLHYLAYHYHWIYLNSYRREADLIYKLKGERRLIIQPLLIVSFLVCSGEVVITWLLVGLVYTLLYGQIVRHYLNFTLLGFTHFRFSLLIILSLTCAAATLSTVYFLCWRKLKLLKIGQ